MRINYINKIKLLIQYILNPWPKTHLVWKCLTTKLYTCYICMLSMFAVFNIQNKPEEKEKKIRLELHSIKIIQIF